MDQQHEEQAPAWHPPHTLSPRQAEVLKFIRVQLAERGFVPSFREIAKAFGVHPTRAEQYVHGLAKKGFVRRSGGQARAMTLVLGWASPGKPRSS